MRIWMVLWLLSLTLVGRAGPPEVALFEGGEGLTYFRQCASLFDGLAFSGDPRMSEKIRIRLLEGHPPEVTNANLPYDRLIDQGKILDLSPWLRDPQTNWEKTFLPGSLDRYRRGQAVYAIPVQYVVYACYYDRRLFRQHGWQPPKDWDEWLQLCQQVQQQGLAPLAFPGRYAFYLHPLIQHNLYHLGGADVYQRSFQLQPGSFDHPAMRESLRRVGELAANYFQPGFTGMSHTEAQMEFLGGRAAMYVCGSWFKSEMASKVPADFELGQFPIPPPPDSLQSPRALQVGASYFFVFANAKHPELGVQYLQALTDPNRIRQLVREQDLPVAIAGANQALSPDLEGLSAMLASSTESFGEALHRTHPGMAQVWSDVHNDLLFQRVPPDPLAQKLEAEAARLRQPPSPSNRSLLWFIPPLALLLLGLLPFQRGPRPGTLGHLPRPDGLLLVGLPLLLYLGFFLGPGLSALPLSALEWDGLSPPQWCGGANFQQLFSSPGFLRACLNTGYLMLTIPLLVTLWALVFSVFLQGRSRSNRSLRALFFFPNLLGIGAILVWQQIYHPQGPLNAVLAGIGLSGLENFAWLSQPHLYTSLLPLALWSASGLPLLMLGAALTQTPQELYEAAQLEGANGWQQFWLVSWPHIRPTVWACIFLLVVSSLKSFETIWLLTHQQPSSQVHVLGTLMVQLAFVEFKMGPAVALAVLMLGLVLVLKACLASTEEAP